MYILITTLCFTKHATGVPKFANWGSTYSQSVLYIRNNHMIFTRVQKSVTIGFFWVELLVQIPNTWDYIYNSGCTIISYSTKCLPSERCTIIVLWSKLSKPSFHRFHFCNHHCESSQTLGSSECSGGNSTYPMKWILRNALPTVTLMAPFRILLYLQLPLYCSLQQSSIG